MATKKTSKTSGSKSVKVGDLKPSKDAKGGVASKRSDSNAHIGRSPNARVGRQLN